MTAGQAVTYYTSHFYALFFLQTVLKVPAATAYGIVAVAVVIGTPAFVIFGATVRHARQEADHDGGESSVGAFVFRAVSWR